MAGALGSGASRDPSPGAFTTRSAASWRFRDRANPRRCASPVMEVLHARSDVAHTDPSSVVGNCGICHAHFCEWIDGVSVVSGWMDFLFVISHS